MRRHDTAPKQHAPPNNTLLSIPTIEEIPGKIKIEQKEWTIFINTDFNSILNEQNIARLKKQIECGLEQNHRIQMELSTISLLITILYDVQEIRVCSCQANYELFSIGEIEANIHLLSNPQLREKYQLLQKHIEKTVALNPNNFPLISEQVGRRYNLLSNNLEQEIADAQVSALPLISKLHNKILKYRPGIFEKLSDIGLELIADYDILRINLLKFFAILPALDHDIFGGEVKSILRETIQRLISESRYGNCVRPLNRFSIFILNILDKLSWATPAFILAKIVRFSVRLMAKRFIAGTTIAGATESIATLKAQGRDVTLDQLGELVVSENEADNYQAKVLELIKGCSQHIPTGEKNEAEINCANVSLKMSALTSDFNPDSFETTYAQVAPRLKNILLAAKENYVYINIDVEHFHYVELAFDIFARVLLTHPELSDYQQTGTVVQAYLRNSYEHFTRILELAKKRNLTMPIRLVKGAYWDAETIEATVFGFDAPEFLNKEETDIHFRKLIHQILANYPHVQLCLASHNIYDHCFAETLREKYFPTTPLIEHQCLHMTYEALSTALAQVGCVTRNYVPIGGLLIGMAYLVRRIMENSSQVGILNMVRSNKKIDKNLTPTKELNKKIEEKKIIFDTSINHLTSKFQNIAPVRLYIRQEREYFLEYINSFKKNCLGKFYPNKFPINGKKITIVSPSDPSIKVGKIDFANINDVGRAIKEAHKAYASGSWAHCQSVERISIILKAAELMLIKRLELTALIVFEAGKNFPEALADVDEAIDFLNFYSREERRINHNRGNISSRGLITVIAPWNFPCAIPAGMVAGALVAGNGVILKSAEQTPLLAQKVVDLFHEAGVPINSLIHLPGYGEDVGKTLCSSPLVGGIIFTGSKEVGLSIIENASKRIYQNPLTKKFYPTKVVAEMGGKNAIIVTSNAELDETVSGIIYSAFAHAGQKCSAASRIIVHKSIKNNLIKRLKEACKDLKVGPANNPSTFINPLIAQCDVERVRQTVKNATKEAKKYSGKVHIDRSISLSNAEFGGFAVGPTLIEIPLKRAQNQESYAAKEHFAPILHIIPYSKLDQAIELFNSTEYALTGGIFSQSQNDIDYLIKRLEAGNIYINRNCTGARVAIEPFGGFKLSGTGPKAGSSNYINAMHVQQPQKYDEIHNNFGFPHLSRRSKKTTLEIEKFLQSFSTIFNGTWENDKEIITHYLTWIEQHLDSFIRGKFPNKKTAGQINYNDHQLFLEKGIYLAFAQKPDIPNILFILSATARGCQTTVLPQNEAAKKIWTQISAIFSSMEIRSAADKKPDASYLICDGTHKELQNALQEIPLICNNEILKVFTHLDAPPVDEVYRYLLGFTRIRSFAVNTMRHGAPL